MPPALSPDPVAVVREERALREQRRCGRDAEAMLAAAVAAWPDNEALLTDHGLLAHAQMHWPEMAARFAVVRERYPGHVFGYSRLGEALRWLGQLDAAEAAIGEGVPLVSPDNAELLVQWVLVDATAPNARHIDGARRKRAAGTSSRACPTSRTATATPPSRSCGSGALGRAELGGGGGLPARAGAPLVLRFAELAAARQDLGGGGAALRGGNPASARPRAAWLGPPSAAPGRPAGGGWRRCWRRRCCGSGTRWRWRANMPWAASLRRDWTAALARWRALAARLPATRRCASVWWRRNCTPAARPRSAVPAPVPDDLKQLLLHFEPLGEDCELGLVQRHVGLEPLGLLRFAGTTLDNLVAALDSDLAGIGAPEFTHVFLRDGVEYMVNDTRYGLGMHTFTGPDQVSAEQFAAGAGRRLRFLAGKLLDDLREPAKLFVRTSRAREPRERVLRLHRALARHGVANGAAPTLLFVQESAEPGQTGRSEWLAPGVMVGWIERFSIVDPLDAQWHALCRSAFALWQAGPSPPPRPGIEPQAMTGPAMTGPALLQPLAFAPAATFGAGTAPGVGTTPAAAPAAAPRTLLFCTSYVGPGLGARDTWDDRYRLWRRAVAASRVRHDQALIIDDASPTLPTWPDTDVIREGEGLHSGAASVLFRFGEHAGRSGLSDFLGWVRSFCFAAHYAAANGFERVLHLESDAFLISERIQQFVNAVTDGWVGFWCPRYNRPEGAIQVIAGRSLRTFGAFAACGREALAGVEIETALPFTRVERGFRGDRYGEYLDHVPRDAEWSAQTTLAAGAARDAFYWWLAAP